MSAFDVLAMSISIHALLAESDACITTTITCIASFLSTLSLRRATRFGSYSQCSYRFLSTLSLRRATCQWRRSVKLFRQFLSTLSLRRATCFFCAKLLLQLTFLSTLSLRRATGRSWRKQSNHHKFLSTLSLRRATRRHRGNDRRPIHFYPRSPCGERQARSERINRNITFLSTLSLRRATLIRYRINAR